MNAMRFGVNYVPSKNWWYSWSDWEPDSILEDLQAIQSLGMDHIRIHCLWPVFQPNAAWVSPVALDRLEELLDMAVSCGLDTSITVLDGWLSGFAFKPAWQKNRNMFTERTMVEAEKLLFTAITDQIGKHPGFLGFDLGNELSVLSFGNDITTIQGDAWQQELISHCEGIAPNKFHVNGVDHLPWFMDKAFSRDSLANVGAATALHTWIEFTGARRRYAPLDVGSVHLAEYCIELSKAYSRDLNRPVWLQEFGASTSWMSSDLIPEFGDQTIVHAGTCSNLWGFTWWCSHDLSPKLTGFDPLEYDLGLLTCKNQVKPVGKRIAERIRAWNNAPPIPLCRTKALVIPDGLFGVTDARYQYPDNPGWKLAEPFMRLVQQGIRPAIVLESLRWDKDYLKRRGIDELIDIKDVNV